jgi:cardiolipin synthase
MPATTCSLLFTGSQFSRIRQRGVVAVMEELVVSAKQEIHILAYVFRSSANSFLDLIESALQRGVAVTIVVNVIPNEPLSLEGRLKNLNSAYAHASIVRFVDLNGSQLHAKVLVADRSHAVVSSANFTRGGLVANHEIGVLLHGTDARTLAELADQLANSGAAV